MFIFSYLVFNSIISGALWKEGWKERSLIGTNPFRILPSSLLKRERRIICTKRSKTPFWSLLCCEGNSLLCQKMHGKDESKSRVQRGYSTHLSAKCLCAQQEKRIPLQGHFDLWVISVWQWCSRTYLHANTGSRHLKWAPAQQRSWTC